MEDLEIQPIQHISIDDMLQHIGEYKYFQWLLNAVFGMMILPQSYQHLIMYFAALSPSWKCTTNSTVCTFNGTFENDDKTRCSMPRSAWEFTEPKDFSIVTQFDIYCDNEWQIHLTTSIYFLSMSFGSVMYGWLADRFGRKTLIFPSIFVLMLGGVLTTFSPNIYWFLVFRLIVGFVFTGTYNQEVVLISELVGEHYRPIAGGLIWFSFSTSLCILGLKAYFIRRWKMLFIVCTVPYIFVLGFYKFVPESVRWLKLHGKHDEVMKTFNRIASWNKRKLQPHIVVSSDKEATPTSTPIGLFCSTAMAIQTMILCYVWFVIAVIYFGLSLASVDLGGSLYLNYVLISFVEIPTTFLAMYLSIKIGRKNTVIFPLLLGSVSSIVIAFVPYNRNENIARVFLGIFGKFFVTISYCSIYTWAIELFPTSIRAKAIGVVQFTNFIGAASSPWFAKALKVYYRDLPFIVMGTMSLIASLFLFRLPETKSTATAETQLRLINKLIS